jgi:hypothetical protein
MSFCGVYGDKMSSCHFSEDKLIVEPCHNWYNGDEGQKITRGVTLLFYFILQVKYKQDYEKNKGKADYNVLPASENPLLRQLKTAGNVLSDVSQLSSHTALNLNL